MRSIANEHAFVNILRVLETVVIFAMLGLIVYAMFFGIQVGEIRDHYRTSAENEKKILEILQRQEKTQHDVNVIKDEVAPGK